MRYALSARPISIAVLFALGFFAVTLQVPWLTQTLRLSPSSVQFWALPLLCWLVWRCQVWNVFVPRLLLLCALAGALASLLMARYHVSATHGSFVMSRLQGDEYESRSRIVRERLVAALRYQQGGGAARVERFPGALTSMEEVTEFFEKRPAVAAVIWGQPRWLRISFNPHQAVFVADRVMASWTSFLQVHLVPEVPALALSVEPLNDTARFLAGMFSVLPTSEASFEQLLTNAELFSQLEVSLRAASAVQAAWTSFAHRAFPLWVLGNMQLAKALAHGRYEKAGIACAIDSYALALRYLKPKHNPELFAALLNNQSVALYIRSIMEHKPGLRKVAALGFKRATALGHLSAKPAASRHAMKTAEENLVSVKIGKYGAVRQTKKRRAAPRSTMIPRRMRHAQQ